ncbi:MAG TPA: hypothetical protein VI336_03270 [Candidatus Saccharimonadales bacterium]|nr:hypothetical protein [Candidatus Saccharimonadales bacterium]
MPPQTDQNSTPSDKTDFGFMLSQQQPQTQTSSAGRFSNLGKPAKILAATVGVLIIVIAGALILGGGDSSSKQVLDLMAQSQEIARVSQQQDLKFTDTNTKGLSATTQAAMNSQKFELGSYLGKAGVKYGQKELAVKLNQKTDTDLQTAAQNNNLDGAYVSYLKTSLTTYLNSLNSTYQAANSQTLKTNLKAAYDSVQVLLKSPQFKP